MVINVSVAIESIAGAITALGGTYTGIRQVLAVSRRKKEEYRQNILSQAKIEMDKVRKELEDKIKKVEFEVQNQKETIEKDMGHLKESYNAEVKVLGQRIEELRQDLVSQHSSLVALLTKLVDSR